MKRILETSEYNQLFLSKKQLKNIYYFWIGFVFYSGSFCYLLTFGQNKIYAILQFASLILILISAFSLINFNIRNNYLKNVYVLYGIWLIGIISRGFIFEKEFLVSMFFDAWFGLLLYFVPLVLLFPLNIRFLKRIFDVIMLLGLICVFSDIVYLKIIIDPDPTNPISQGFIEYFSKTLAIPCAFIILTFPYHPKKRNFLAMFVIIITFLFAVIRARRGLMFMSASPLIISGILYIIYNRRDIYTILFAIVLFFFISYFASNIYKENRNGLFNIITERIDEDTRTGGEEFFYKDMNTQDWIFGKGINGEYYGPDLDANNNTDFRKVIETGYLQIILNGGIVSLVLLLLIILPAAIKGIFYSKNMFSKAAGLWILLYIMNSYPSTVNTFTLSYILVWIAVSVCYNRDLRNMSENNLKLLFNQAYRLPF